ncbi:MAG: hypothetical protein JST35_09560 [Armatimonadetes bacterium]|nr:hypothetical protein [Armatimonadota bacterium]
MKSTKKAGLIVALAAVGGVIATAQLAPLNSGGGVAQVQEKGNLTVNLTNVRAAEVLDWLRKAGCEFTVEGKYDENRTISIWLNNATKESALRSIAGTLGLSVVKRDGKTVLVQNQTVARVVPPVVNTRNFTLARPMVTSPDVASLRGLTSRVQYTTPKAYRLSRTQNGVNLIPPRVQESGAWTSPYFDKLGYPKFTFPDDENVRAYEWTRKGFRMLDKQGKWRTVKPSEVKIKRGSWSPSDGESFTVFRNGTTAFRLKDGQGLDPKAQAELDKHLKELDEHMKELRKTLNSDLFAIPPMDMKGMSEKDRAELMKEMDKLRKSFDGNLFTIPPMNMKAWSDKDRAKFQKEMEKLRKSLDGRVFSIPPMDGMTEKDRAEMQKRMAELHKSLQGKIMKFELDGSTTFVTRRNNRDWKGLIDSLTPAQLELMKSRGYLKPSDLDPKQQKMVDIESMKGSYTITISMNGKSVTIKGD